MGISKKFVAKNGVDNNNQTLVNVADPVNSQDVATKNFASNASNLTSGIIPDERVSSSFLKRDVDGNLNIINNTKTTTVINVKSADSSSDIAYASSSYTVGGATTTFKQYGSYGSSNDGRYFEVFSGTYNPFGFNLLIVNFV